MIQIFDIEKVDGLEDTINKNQSLSYTSTLSFTDKKIPELAKADFNDFDLHYLESILASVGWNLNDDVFDKEEALKARNTSVHKKFNFMHDESDIIGHIISSRVVDENGNEYTDMSKVPDKFDILDGSVIYKIWSDENRQTRIDKIIAEIQEGKWCVSMECLFSAFDYALITPKGEHKVIARNAESAFLTKYLRAYGGSGVYNDYKIGRLLRNFVFSGKGLVDNPGNPRSVILSTSNFKGDSANLDLIRENSMADTNELEVLKQKLQSAEARAEAAEKTSKEASDKELNSLKDNLKNLTSELATANQKISNLQGNIETLTAANEELKTSKAKVETTLKEVLDKATANEAAAKKQNRLNVLSKKAIDEAKALQLVEKTIASDDETFDILVDTLPNKDAKELTKANLDKGVVDDKVIPTVTDDNKESEVAEKALAWLSSSLQSGQKKK